MTSRDLLPAELLGGRVAFPTGRGSHIDLATVRRIAYSEEIARAAAVLILPIASFVTCAKVVVDAGLTLSRSASFAVAVRVAFPTAERTRA